MKDVELFALATLVHADATHFDAAARQYGEMPFDPVTPSRQTLEAELRARKILP